MTSLKATTVYSQALFLSLILTSVLLTSSCVTAATVKDYPWAEKTPLQERLPGPPRARMMEADNSGTINADIGFIADRLAIINHVTAYPYLIDEGRVDAWFGLFSDDVESNTTSPCEGFTIVKGKEIMMKAFASRGSASDKQKKKEAAMQKHATMRRHAMSNIHVAYQTETRAQVRAYMTISATPPYESTQIVTSGSYNWQLEKRDGRWIGTRLYVEVDSPVPSGLPASNMAEIEFTPDNSPECKL